MHDDTTWIICPALAGPSGLTSDTLLDAMGKYVARWRQPADFPIRARALAVLQN